MPYLRPGRWMLVGLGLDTEVDQYHVGRGRPEDAGAGHGAWQKAADSALPQVPILTSPPPDHILCPGTRSCFCSASSSWWSGLPPGKRSKSKRSSRPPCLQNTPCLRRQETEAQGSLFFFISVEPYL